MSSAANTAFEYAGGELDVFQHAVRWKSYYQRRLRPYLRGEVLEVGGGIGATARVLCGPEVSGWTSLEPDPRLAGRMGESFREQPLPAPARVLVGTLADLPPEPCCDAVIYIDVLEHIEDDRAELREVLPRLRPGGHLAVLSPAHPWLFTPFDEAIGHFRRYTRKSLRAAAPPGLQEVRMEYLDAAGFFASLANRLLLRAAHPTLGQIRFWDGVLVPCSTWIDPLLAGTFGKSVLGVWRRAAGADDAQ